MTFKRFVLLLLVLVSARAAGAQNREHLQMNADLRILQEQVARLQLSLNQLAEQMKGLNKKLDDQANATQKGFADEQVLVSGIATSNATIREKIDDNSVRVSQLSQEFRSVQQGLRLLTDQFNTLTTLLQPPVNPQDPNAPQNAATPPGGGVRMPESPADVFNAAMGDYMKNDLDSAVEGFKEFLRNFPDAPDAARAQLHVGLAYHSMTPPKYQDALDAYAKLISAYKDAPEVPDAYYEQALIYSERQQRTQAQRILELIIKQFPDSDKAILATQKLKTWGVIK